MVTTFPEHAVVSVDGQYAGSTPWHDFLKHGSRTVELSKPFYAPVSVQRGVGGRVLRTLFVRDKTSLQRTLAVADPLGPAQGHSFRFPEEPRDSVARLRCRFRLVRQRQPGSALSFLSDAMGIMTAESQIRELVSAASRVASRGTFLTPSSFVVMLQHAAQITQKYDNFPSWLLLSLSKPNATKLAATPWVQQYLSAYGDALSRYYQPGSSPPPASSGSVSVAGVTLRAIPSGDLVMGKDDNLSTLGKSVDRLLPHPVHVDAFYLGANEITNAQFLAFVNENPDWAASNRDALVARGLVTDTYLSQWTNGAPPAGAANLPVTSVSWNAATAYATWLSRRVQATLPGYIARLPWNPDGSGRRAGAAGMPYPLGGKPRQCRLLQKGITGPSPVGASVPNRVRPARHVGQCMGVVRRYRSRCTANLLSLPGPPAKDCRSSVPSPIHRTVSCEAAVGRTCPARTRCIRAATSPWTGARRTLVSASRVARQ